MKTINYLIPVLMALVVFAGCSRPDYGNISKQTDTQSAVSIEELSERWDEFDTYWASRSGAIPAAVMFDPKNDDKKLVGDSWHKIVDKVTLTKAIDSVGLWNRYSKVRVIQGPDKEFFGYMYYSPRLFVPVKRLDENTLHVSSLPMPKSAP